MEKLTIEVAELLGDVTRVIEAVGVEHASAREVAESLVEADMSGHGTHGVFLVPMYVAQLSAGTVSNGSTAGVVHETPATATLDAGGILGALSARQAMSLAIGKARSCGVGVVAVRHAFHFGTAGRFARQAAEAGFIGVAAANTRPMMPSTGGQTPVVGNNPIAFAFPGGEEPVVIDLALSATSLGAIREAAAAKSPIPIDWATDSEGHPTTDPLAAIAGMLLPIAGPKGFGLAIAVELLTGGLSQGAVTQDVGGLYVEPLVRQNSSQFFLALDPGAFGPVSEFEDRVQLVRERIEEAGSETGVAHAPGGRSSAARREAKANGVVVSSRSYEAFAACAASLGVSLSVSSSDSLSSGGSL